QAHDGCAPVEVILLQPAPHRLHLMVELDRQAARILHPYGGTLPPFLAGHDAPYGQTGVAKALFQQRKITRPGDAKGDVGDGRPSSPAQDEAVVLALFVSP